MNAESISFLIDAYVKIDEIYRGESQDETLEALDDAMIQIASVVNAYMAKRHPNIPPLYVRVD